MIKFNATREELEIISKIAKRANRILGISVKDTVMDLDATISNGTPLRLQELLEAPDFDFLHDVTGIALHIDRALTGQLKDCFVPRFARSCREVSNP